MHSKCCKLTTASGIRKWSSLNRQWVAHWTTVSTGSGGDPHQALCKRDEVVGKQRRPLLHPILWEKAGSRAVV